MHDAKYVGLHVGKKADDPNDPNAVWFADHLTGEMSIKPFRGATFLDELSQPTEDAPEYIVLPLDYVDREPWIEIIGKRRELVNGGPPDDPQAMIHNLVHGDQLVLHMLQADFVYEIDENPGRYGDELRNYYTATLVSTGPATGFDRTTGFLNTQAGRGNAPEYVSAREV